MPTASRSAMSGGMSCIVEQLGLAMIPSCQARSSGLTWLTTSGTAGSMRHALELSITTQPRLAASGASSFEVPPPAAEDRDVDALEGVGCRELDGEVPVPSTVTVLPAERSEARRRSSVYGNRFSREDLDHGAADGAGGADDGDGELVWAGSGHGPTC